MKITASIRLLALAGAAALAGLPSARAQQSISVNFVGGGNGANTNGSTVTGTAGAFRSSTWNNETAASGSSLTLASTATSSAATLTYSSVNNYGATPTGSGTSGGTGDLALMTGYLDTTGGTPPTLTVSNLGMTFTTGGYSVLVYDNTDHAGTAGFTVSSGSLTQTAYLDQVTGNGGNYPLADGTNGYIESIAATAAAATTASNYVLLTGFTGSSFTLTGVTGSGRAGARRLPDHLGRTRTDHLGERHVAAGRGGPDPCTAARARPEPGRRRTPPPRPTRQPSIRGGRGFV